MNYDENLNYIHSLGMFSRPAGLERITAVMQALGNPQDTFKSVHVAGTNGKGSVTVMIAAVLRAMGLKVATFTSPSIVDFRERIQINGEFIPKNELCRIAQTVRDIGIELTEFEFVTALGFLYFAEQKVDVAVVETGLGGRLDATNVLKNVSACVITKIGLDHTKILGDTVQKIATEKCGIIIPGIPVVTSPSQLPGALGVIREYAPQLVLPDIKDLSIISSDIYGSRFVYKDNEYEITMPGLFQTENAVTAIETVTRVFACDTRFVKAGIKSAFIPVRLEVVSRAPLIVLDGAHNPSAAEELSHFMRRFSDCTVVIAAMADKDYEKVLSLTLPFAKNAVCTEISGTNRALKAKKLADTAAKYCNNIFCSETVSTALALAKRLAGSGGSIFVYGSLYLSSEARALLKPLDSAGFRI